MREMVQHERNKNKEDRSPMQREFPAMRPNAIAVGTHPEPLGILGRTRVRREDVCKRILCTMVLCDGPIEIGRVVVDGELVDVAFAVYGPVGEISDLAEIVAPVQPDE